MHTRQAFIRKRSAFTLIELLVVISIISLLATLVVTQLGTARGKSRDARRISDIRQIQSALEQFYLDNNFYPPSGNCGTVTMPNGSWCNSNESVSNGHWLRSGATTLSAYLTVDPVDPVNKIPAIDFSQSHVYNYYANSYGTPTPVSQWYMMVYALENFPSPIEQQQRYTTASDGSVFGYGSGSNGILTVGAKKP